MENRPNLLILFLPEWILKLSFNNAIEWNQLLSIMSEWSLFTSNNEFNLQVNSPTTARSDPDVTTRLGLDCYIQVTNHSIQVQGNHHGRNANLLKHIMNKFCSVERLCQQKKICTYTYTRSVQIDITLASAKLYRDYHSATTFNLYVSFISDIWFWLNFEVIFYSCAPNGQFLGLMWGQKLLCGLLM